MPIFSHCLTPIAQIAAALLLAASLLAAPTSTATFTAAKTPQLRINEVIANSTGGDRIELYNAGSTAIDLGGKVLMDQPADPTKPTRFVFPAGTNIAAGGYLVVFADSNAGPLHTGFSLDAEGDEVWLYDSLALATAAKAGTESDVIKFGFQIPEFSLSRTGSGGDVWALTVPTFGAANAPAVSLASLSNLKINEWAGKITFRLDHDLIELYSPTLQPVAIGGVRLTDNVANPTRFVFPPLSFIAPGGFLPLYGADFAFGLDGDRETITLLGENNEQIDQVNLVNQPMDRSSGRVPDGSNNIVDLPVPSPGLSNSTPLPASYTALLNNLRITEVMYQPAAPSNSSSYEFIELQNIGTTPLDLSGVRFTNGLDYEFPAGTSLAAGAFIVVVNDRSSFLSRYPNAASVMAPGAYNGGLDNTGETIALTLPPPWRVHILRFRFEPSWYPSTAGGGNSLVVASPFTASPADWQNAGTWRPSAAVNGSPGVADPGTAGAGPTARLANLSVRTNLAAAQTLIVGTVVSGGPRNILVRAAGPALTGFGLSGAMTDPRLELFDGQTLTFANDDWPSTLANTFTSVAAFPFQAGSKDAAFVQSIDGARSIQAKGTGAGVVLVEAYDTGTTNSPRLVNVSARNRVGTGDDILIAGFNIAGTGAKQLLIRAVGPKLATFGVTGVLTDPKLEIYNSAGVKLTENDNWNAALAPTFTAVSAFQLDPGSRDAALLVTLDPGTYTVQVRGADGGTGEALIEIYEAP